MFYGLTRIIFWIAVLLILIKNLKKRQAKKRDFYILIIAVLILCQLSFGVPIENLILDFKTPEQVFNFTAMGEIEDIIYGKDTCMVIYKTGKTSHELTLILRTEKGYKIGGSLKVHKQYLVDNISVKIFNARNTTDYYIVIFFVAKEDSINIEDNKNSIFIKNFSLEEYNQYKTIIVYTYVDNITDDYCLTVNGKKLIMNE